MSILNSYKANKAIATLLSSQQTDVTEAKEAIAKIKKIGNAAVPKLIDALAEEHDNPVIESLLTGFLNNKTLPNYIDGLAYEDKHVVARIMHILAKSTKYDANRLYELFDDPDIPKNVLVQILLAQKKSLDAKTLLAMLDKVDKNVKQLVFRIISEISTDAMVPDLIRYANHSDAAIRLNITTTLAKFSHEKSRDTLVGLLSDTNKRVRQAALEGLGKIKIAVPVKPICRLLKDPDMTVQAKAIDALIDIKDPDTVKYLIDILQDESEYVRRAAVEVLNEVGDPRAIKDLLNAMRDSDWWVKVRAADALGSIGGPKVVEAVLELIKDEDEFLRRTAVEILNSLKDDRAFDHLVIALKDKDWWVRERAADALAALGDKRAVPHLLDVLESEPDSSQPIITALAKLGDNRAIPKLIDKLQTDKISTQKEVINALGELVDKENFSDVRKAIAELVRAPEKEISELADETMQTVIARFNDKQSPTEGKPDEPSSQQKNSNVDIVDMSSIISSAGIIDATTLQADQILADRYRVIKQVGKGAFGVVILVEDIVVSDEIVLKFLNPHMASDESVVKRFLHELRYSRKITHENVIRIYDFISFGKSHAISMEYFPSHSLAYELKRKKSRDIKRTLHIFLDVCNGLWVAHQADVVHRDLKPANILINDDNIVKIVDFGLAAAASQTDSRITKSGILVGTPTYMAPEQVRGRTIDTRTDIYSLGILLYEILCGKPPYKGEDHMATLFQHVEGKATPAIELNPKIGAELNGIIMKAMALKPEDRYQTIDDLRNDLRAELAKFG